MRKAFKIILAVFAVLVIFGVAFGAIFFLDFSAYTATGTENIPSTGQVYIRALVVYDPGLSGAAKDVASKVATDLSARGYSVELAGIKSAAAANTSGCAVIVVGGPIYAGAPTSSVKDFLNNLKPVEGARVGVFGSGQGSTTPDDVAQIKGSVVALQTGGSLSNALIVKIGSSEDLNARTADFVTQLLK